MHMCIRNVQLNVVVVKTYNASQESNKKTRQNEHNMNKTNNLFKN